MSEFYTSGGLNDSTGREPFEDNTPLVRQGGDYDASSTSGGVGAGNALGDGNLVATTGGNQGDSTGFAGQTTGTRGGDDYDNNNNDSSFGRSGAGTGISSDPRDHYDNSAKEQVRGAYESGSNDNDNYNSNTGSSSLKDKVKGAIASKSNNNNDNNDNYRSENRDESSNVNTGGLTGGFGNTQGSHARVADQIDGDYSTSGRQTGDAFNSSSNRQTGDDYSGDNQGQDRSAGFGRDGGVGNQGVGAGGYTSGSGVSSGAAGTDRFDVDSSSSGATHGQAIGDKRVDNDNIGRHGDDFTGGFAATGGAYTNENTKTGLTGRETTTSGVQDKDGHATQSSGGLLGKIKNAVGLSHDNSAQANASSERDY